MSLHQTRQNARPGFICGMDAHSAKRQLHVSAGVAAVLGLAILGSVAVIRPASGFDQQAQRAHYEASIAVVHQPVSADIRAMANHGG